MNLKKASTPVLQLTMGWKADNISRPIPSQENENAEKNEIEESPEILPNIVTVLEYILADP